MAKNIDSKEAKDSSKIDICSLTLEPVTKDGSRNQQIQLLLKASLTLGRVTDRGNTSSHKKKTKKFADFVMQLKQRRLTSITSLQTSIINYIHWFSLKEISSNCFLEISFK